MESNNISNLSCACVVADVESTRDILIGPMHVDAGVLATPTTRKSLQTHNEEPARNTIYLTEVVGRNLLSVVGLNDNYCCLKLHRVLSIKWLRLPFIDYRMFFKFTYGRRIVTCHLSAGTNHSGFVNVFSYVIGKVCSSPG